MLLKNFKLDQNELEEELSSSLQEDLKIIHKAKTYSVISIMAAAKSRYIYNLFLSDPLINKIELNLPKGDLTPIIKFLNGESFNYSNGSTLFLYQASIELEIDELNNILQNKISDQLDFQLAIRLLKQAFCHGFDCPAVMQYISKNLNERTAQDLFKQLSEAQIDFLFRKEDFTLDQMMLVLDKFDFANKPNNRLSKYISDPSILASNPNLNLNTLRYILIKRFFSIRPTEE